MRKLIPIIMVIALVCSMLIACEPAVKPTTPDPVATETTEQNATEEPAVEVTPEPEPEPDPVWLAEGALDEDTKAIFDKATEELVGVNYVPLAYLGNKVYADKTLHAYFCSATVVYPDSVAYPTVVFVTEAGNDYIMDLVKNISMEDSMKVDNAASSESQDAKLMLNWVVPEGMAVTEEDVELVKTALNGYTATNYELLLHVADDTDKALSCFLCRATVNNVEDESPHYVLMFVSAEENDGAKVAKVTHVNLEVLSTGIYDD